MMRMILDLPSEILADIFLHLAHELRETAKPYRWIYVSHVCLAWRRTALEDCRLWSAPPFTHDDARTCEMLERARAAPLHVVIDFNRLCSPSCLKLAFENLHRARSFTVYGVMPAHHEAFIKTHYSETVFQTPSLQSINISSTIASNRTAFLLDIISLNSPRLRNLDLQNWRLSKRVYSSPVFTELTSLVIIISDDVLSHSAKREVFSTVLGYLSSLQRLQRLQLQNVFQGNNEAGLGSPPGFILPDLKELTLHTYTRACLLFLSTVTFPEDATVSLGCGDNVCLSMGLAEPCIKRLRDPVRAMHIHKCDSERLEFKFWTIPCDEDLGYTEKLPILSIITPIPLAEAPFGIMRHLQHLEHLVYQTPLSIFYWLEGIEDAEHLTLLEVYDTDTTLYELLDPPVLCNLDLPIDSETEEVQPQMNLPALRDLTLNKWGLQTDDDDVHADFDDLIEVLEKRQRCGYGLTNLNFWKCRGPNYDQLEELLGLAENVYVDN